MSYSISYKRLELLKVHSLEYRSSRTSHTVIKY